MPDMLFFPPAMQRAEAIEDVITWVANWPLPREAKKAALTLWAKTFDVTLTAEDWKRAIPEEV